MLSINKKTLSSLFVLPVIVAALGYFVDIYDLLLFGIVRMPSLKSLGLSDAEISKIGMEILNWQMIGLLVGGIFWGVLGDKKGRLSVLFGSIITYSIANIGCGFVQDPNLYMLLRFIAGIGLAGELGAGITLVSEILPIQLRAIGSSMVAGIGVLGAVVAFFTVELFNWRNAYFFGGAMGIALLLLRVGVVESGAFDKISKQKHVIKGNFLTLFTNWKRFVKYLRCIGIGLPTWFVIGILATFSNEIGKSLHIVEPVKPGLAILWSYAGLSIGDILCGFISQRLQSRKKAVLYFMMFTLMACFILLIGIIETAKQYYLLSLITGIGIGYWAMFVTISAEQFGTNLRATAATTVPNMVRGIVVLMTLGFSYFKSFTTVTLSASIVGVICFAIGIYSIVSIGETHGKDLDYLEE